MPPRVFLKLPFAYAEGAVDMENGNTRGFRCALPLLKTCHCRSHPASADGCRGARKACACLYLPFQAAPASSFSLTPCPLRFVLFSCVLPSSVSLVHNVCTNFQASVQVNRNLVLPLVSREPIAIEVSIGECRASGCTKGNNILSRYQGIRIS